MALSYQNYTGDNVTDTFSIPFTYTDTSEISVTVDGVAQTGLTFPSASTVQLTSPPATSTLVQVRRATDLTARSIDYVSGSVLTEEDLDNANIQVFHASQEAVDTAGDAVGLDSDDKMDAQSKVIKNVADPVSAQDAVTKNYLENTWLTLDDKAQLNSLNTANLDTVANDITNVNTVATNIANVNTVAGVSGNVTTVATDIANVNTVAADLNEPVSEIDTVANNITNVNTVGGISTDVTTVAGIASDVTAVAADATDIGTVSTNIANVNTVAGISSDVTTVSGISGNVTSVANDATDIGTVASNIANVNTVAGISANVSTVAGDQVDIGTVASNIASVNTVAANNTNVSTVAGISADVTAVAGISGDIQDVQDKLVQIQAVADDLQEVTSEIETVAASIANVDTVGGAITNVNTVATNVANVNTVAGISSNVTTVAGISANVTTVAGISSDVTAVAADATDIGTVATNLAGTDTIGTVATNIANVNSVGGSISNVNTVATNISSVNDFADKYRIGASDPTTNNDEGDLFYNTTTDTLKVYTGTAWEQGVTAGSGFLPTTGGSLTGDVSFGDNNKAIFGAGSDLQIYHDGSHSRIYDNGGGELKIMSNGTAVRIQKDNGENMILANTDGAVNLYYDSLAKLATTSGGIDVTGTVTADSGTHTFGDGTGTSQLVLLAGTTGNSTLDFGDSADSNIGRIQYEHTNDALTFRTNNSERMRLDSSGRLGLGTTAPTSPLHVETTSQRVGTFISTGADPQVYIGDAASSDNAFILGYDRADNRGYLTVAGDSDSVFTIANGGNVGIGTASPSFKLDVAGNARASYFALRSNETAPSEAAFIYRPATGVLGFGTGNTERMRVTNSGDVGINISSPTSILHVNETSTRAASLTFGARAGQVFRNENAEIAFGLDSSSPYGLYMQGRYSNNTARNISINPLGGSVGINTASPSAKLHVGGGNLQQFIENTSGSGIARLNIQSTTNDGYQHAGIGLQDGTNQTELMLVTGNNFAIVHGGSERARLDASGNLLIGKTTAAGGSAVVGIDLRPDGILNVARDGSRPVIFNRKTSTGQLVEFKYNDTTVGSIDVTGSGTTYNTTSDIRLKTDIAPIADATDKLMAMNAVSHKWKSDPDADAVVGFIAQEMAEIVPEAVSKGEGEDDMWSMDYGRITPVLVAALQDAHKKIEQLEQRIAEMEAK